MKKLELIGRRAGQKQGHSKAEFRKETNNRFKLIFTILDELNPDDQEGGRKMGFIDTNNSTPYQLEVAICDHLCGQDGLQVSPYIWDDYRLGAPNLSPKSSPA